MDNKITKKRLSEFIQYEWIKILALALCVCLVWRLVFISIGAVGNRLTIGQQFNIYYSSDIDGNCLTSAQADFGLNSGVLSYEVQEFSVSQLDSSYTSTQLTAWLSEGFGDLMICSNKTTENKKVSFFEDLIDNYGANTDFDTLYQDAYAYAETFMIDKTASDPLSLENIDDNKVKSAFTKRLSDDNRFKTAEQKVAGEKKEKARIEKHFYNVKALKKILAQDIFVEYVKYSATYLNGNQQIKDRLKDEYEAELNKDNPAKKYAIDFSKIPQTEGKSSISKYGVLYGETEKNSAVLTVFDSKKFQPDLQYETLSVIVEIIKNTTNILENL
jgi:hypothetical protein